ncbi:MAG: hypoxanthine phosphoribosyltransferase [Thermogutta sp.]|nr:hypoxanthine phosphoribosyltransferase [Thermogutta sp.]
MQVLIAEDKLRETIDRLARQIEETYAGRKLTIIGLLLGSVVFLADLVRRISIPYELEMVSSRQPTGTSGRPGPLVINPDVLAPIVEGRDVLVVDDVFDTGETLWELIPQLDDLGAARVRSVVLLVKQGRRRAPVQPDFKAFDIPDLFVVGYGMDYLGKYRHLPYVAALDPTELAAEAGP